MAHTIDDAIYDGCDKSYNSGLSKNQWLNLLNDKEIFTENSLKLLKRILHSNGKASCAELAAIYGGDANLYNRNASALGQRVYKKTNCTLYSSGKDFYLIVFTGSYNSDNRYDFILRPELWNALEELGGENWPLLKTVPLYENDLVSQWVTPCNPEKYDHKNAFKSLKTVFWKQSTTVKVGDIVYIYVSGDEKKLRYKCECIKSNCTEIGLNDKEYCSQELLKSIEENESKAMELKVLRSFDFEELDFTHLEQHGLNTIQGPQKLKNDTIKYINSILESGGTQMQQTTYTKHASLINLLKANHNLIFHGAPGTGKTFTAKEMAAQMIFDGNVPADFENDPKFKEQFGFVQFHPSHDYTDFVEGLRPCKNDGGQNVSGFERVDGVFKKFCEQAARNLNGSKKSKEELEKELSAEESLNSFLDEALNNNDMKFHTLTGNEFYISVVEEDYCEVYIPENPQIKNLRINKNELLELLKSDTKFETVKDITRFFNKNHATQHYSYEFIIVNEVLKQKKTSTIKSETVERKNFIFVIDEINRGETSKIFGELFFSIDPGYRGISGRITTQYQNLVEGGEFAKGFYVPENVYIIGTMNDIDRSVETMDFAFRRRFAWKEIKAKDTQNMLDSLINVNGITEETINLAKTKMDAINQKIATTPDLDESYQIGAAYFMKLRQYNGDFEALWNYHIKGLITEYLRGQGDLAKLVAEFKTVYDGASVKQIETVFVQNNAALDKDSTTIIKNFRNWLSQKDYSENTINAYCSWIPRILNEENTNMIDFITNIDKMCTEYDIGGEKADKGEIGHATVRNTLKRFSEFCKL